MVIRQSTKSDQTASCKLKDPHLCINKIYIRSITFIITKSNSWSWLKPFMSTRTKQNIEANRKTSDLEGLDTHIAPMYWIVQSRKVLGWKNNIRFTVKPMLRNLIQEIMKIFHFIWLELYRANVRWSLPTYHDARSLKSKDPKQSKPKIHQKFSGITLWDLEAAEKFYFLSLAPHLFYSGT